MRRVSRRRRDPAAPRTTTVAPAVAMGRPQPPTEGPTLAETRRKPVATIRRPIQTPAPTRPAAAVAASTTPVRVSPARSTMPVARWETRALLARTARCVPKASASYRPRVDPTTAMGAATAIRASTARTKPRVDRAAISAARARTKARAKPVLARSLASCRVMDAVLRMASAWVPMRSPLERAVSVRARASTVAPTPRAATARASRRRARRAATGAATAIRVSTAARTTPVGQTEARVRRAARACSAARRAALPSSTRSGT